MEKEEEQILFEELVKKLWDNDWRLRKEAVIALGDLDDSRAIEPLLLLLETENYKTLGIEYNSADFPPPHPIRIEIYKALSKLEDERIINPLIVMLKNRRLEREGLELLIRFGHRSIEPIIHAYAELSKEITEKGHNLGLYRRDILQEFSRLLVEFKDQEVRDIYLAEIKNKDVNIRKLVTNALIGLDDSAVIEPLINELSDPFQILPVKKDIINFLGKTKEQKCIEPLISILEREERLKRDTITALGNLGGEKAEEILLNELEETPNLQEKNIIIKSLGKVGGEKTVKALIQRMYDEYYNIDFTIIKALEELDYPNITKLLLELLKEEDINSKRSTIKVIGKLGEKEAVEPLLDLLQNEDSEIVENSIEALGKLGDMRVFDPIANKLDDENERIREKAVSAIASLGTKQAEIVLQKRLEIETNRHLLKKIRGALSFLRKR